MQPVIVSTQVVVKPRVVPVALWHKPSKNHLLLHYKHVLFLMLKYERVTRCGYLAFDGSVMLLIW